MDPFALFWLIAGIGLILLELVIPGLVVIFLGIAALLVGGAVNLGYITDLLPALTAWFMGSILLVVLFRGMLLKLAPTGDVSIAKVDDAAELIGRVVTIVDEVGPEPGGRILVQDSTWPAITQGKVIPKGANAQILSRINLTYLVEACGEVELVNK